MSENTGLLRIDAPAESKWAGHTIFPTWADWQSEYEDVKGEIESLAEFQGTLMSSPERLAAWMKKMNGLTLRATRLGSFARFAATVDGTDIDAKSAMGQASGMMAEFGAEAAFSVPEMLADAEKLLLWAEEEPGLALYAHHFENLVRQKAHLRSTEVEEILSMLGAPFDGVYQVFTELVNTDMAFEDAVGTDGNRFVVKQSTLSNSLQSLDRERRQTAWENYYDGYLGMQNTLGTNYLTWIKQQVFMAKTRSYGSVLEMRLAPFNVPLEMFHNLIDTFISNLPMWHRYWAIIRLYSLG